MSYFDDNEDDIVFGRCRLVRDPWGAVCRKCGQGGLKYRPGEGLFENERVEHNRLKRHDCQTSADDFEVLP